jgi:hypothetical protein
MSYQTWISEVNSRLEQDYAARKEAEQQLEFEKNRALQAQSIPKRAKPEPDPIYDADEIPEPVFGVFDPSQIAQTTELKMFKMHSRGLTDVNISELTGHNTFVVKAWREKYGLKQNKHTSGKKVV